MDDGCFDKKHNTYKISTDCFDKENLKEFVKFLKEKFDLGFIIHTNNELYLRHKYNDNFTQILDKYNRCETMNYKIMSSHKTPLNEGTPDVDNLVLNPLEIEENA